jgi:CPA2 family monovalent cation:H+ antiporter-2
MATIELFHWSSLLPLVILFAIGSLIPILISIFHWKNAPVLSIEILVGIILGNIVLHLPDSFASLFIQVGEEENVITPLLQGFYQIGLVFFLFLSGLDTDFSVLHKEYKKDTPTLSPMKVAQKLFIAVVVLSLLLSIGISFTSYVNAEKRLFPILCLTIIFASTFASIVIPIVNDYHLGKTTIGKIISTYSTIAEFTSIALLSILSITIKQNNHIWILIILAFLMIACFLLERYFNPKALIDKMEGIVHLSMRLIIVLLLVSVLLSDYCCVEPIFGAFMAGMILKASRLGKHTIEKVDAVGYGIFIPMFFSLVGFQVGLELPVRSLI